MRIGIMGIGYVGLPLAVAFAEQGHDVVGVDVDTRKTEALTRGESYIEDIPSPRLQAVLHRLEATTRAANLSRCDAVLICVPTPLTANREPDLGPLVSATRVLADLLQPGQLVVLESTTSQMSMFIRSQSIASSLTSAMFTERKMFSSSFVNSAASGVETRCTVSIARS